MTKLTDIYAAAKDANLEIDNWYSDLHLRFSFEAMRLVKSYEFRDNCRLFTSEIDGQLWYDIPFAFTPFWTERMDAIEKGDN